MDIVLCETGDGGDFIFKNGDFVLTNGMTNQPYLGWFGGNIGGEERDKEDAPQSEQRTDWWGNDLLFQQDLQFYFNSELETLLQKSALNSGQRILIEEIAEMDLSFMEGFGSVDVEATIIDIDRIEITAKITEPDNEENKIFTFIWDATKAEAECLCKDYVKKSPVVQGDEYSLTDYSSSDYTP